MGTFSSARRPARRGGVRGRSMGRKMHGAHGGVSDALRLLGDEGARLPTAVKVFVWMRYFHVLAPAWVAVLLFRWCAGRVMLRKRTTDATWMHRARAVSGGWWAERAGWVRQSARLAPLYVLLAWAMWGAVAAALLTMCAAALAGWWGLRRWREREHDRAWLWPMWPAIARTLGSEAEHAPPRAWVEMPDDPAAEDAEIVVGLPAEIGDVARTVTALRTIFDQRLGVGQWVAHTEPGAELVRFTPRPADPDLWPAVASVLRLPEDAVSGDWLTMPADPAAEDARVVVTLPRDVPDPRRVVEQLRELIGARLPGTWSTRAALSERVVALVHRRPEPTPPRSAPAEGVAPFTARFGGGLPVAADLEGLLSGLVDEPAPAAARVWLDDDENDGYEAPEITYKEPTDAPTTRGAA